jgi:GPI-anchor transamidase subunit U
VPAMLALALSSYLSLYPILLIVPLVLLCHDQQSVPKPKTIAQIAAIALPTFVSAAAALTFLSYILTGGSWEFLSSTYGVQLLLPDLTPNVGLWWYFFIEMFDSFREFFLGVFWLHLAGYVGGLTCRLRYVFGK